MISQTQIQQECFGSIIQRHTTKICEVDKWDQNIQRLVKTNINITIADNNSIIYSFDGAILREELIEDISRNLEILTNMEQIKHLRWQGKYGLDKKKLGKWTATWNGQAIARWIQENNRLDSILHEWIKRRFMDIANQELLKVQLMNQSKNSRAQAYETGEYFHEQKYGRWKYIYDSNYIGGGSYNEQSQKNGKWVELQDSFSDDSRVIVKGEYKNGKKVGRWDICFTKYSSYPFLQSGGGSYDERGDGIKLGKWVEVSDGFFKYSQVAQNGEYKNGNKVGTWDIWDKENKQNVKIRNNEVKLGNWVIEWDGFYSKFQATCGGEYQNGEKVGRWNIFWNYNGHNQQMSYEVYVSDGGSYDEKGDGIKLGMWVELWDKFDYYFQVTYIGEYQNGKKVVRWDIWYQDCKNQKNDKIGGGSYDQKEGGIKFGNWVDVSDGFTMDSAITYDGKYKNGKNVGRWDIWYHDFRIEKNDKMFGLAMYLCDCDSV